MPQAESTERKQPAGPLRVRLRPDLVARRHMSGAETRWAIKDPVALNYFHFGEREWFLLNCFDGKSSTDEIKQEFFRQYAPFELSDADLGIFLRRVHSDGLVIVDQHGQGQQQIERSGKLRRQQTLGRMISILAIRFKGIDPQGLLSFLSPIGQVLFHPLTLVVVALASILTLTAGVIQAESVVERLPGFSWFVQGENLIWMMLALSIVKILHEFGHGLACHYYGGECHEMGLMFLVFSPCLYCNVSDAWMLPNKWHRILISSAGIYVELILATICFWGWYFTHPGMLNSILLSVVFICSVNTLFLNGNPLLRYDGYYILSDLVNVPNLAAQARQALWGPITDWLTKQQDDSEGKSRTRWGLVIYAVAAIAYRFFIVTTIIWLVYTTLKQYELQVVGQFVVAVILTGVFLPLVTKLLRLFKTPGGLSMIRWARLCIVLVVLGVGAVALLSTPLPTYVKAPALVESPEAEAIYAPYEGILLWAEPEGKSLDKDALVCVIENKRLEREKDAIADEIEQVQVEIQTLELVATYDPSTSAQVLELESQVEDLKNRQNMVQQDIDRLQVATSEAGRVIRPEPRDRPVDRERALPQWNGAPIDPENQGCFLQRGDLICYVGKPSQSQIVMYVSQEQIDLINVGDSVEIRLDQLRGKILKASVAGISREEITKAPSALVVASDFAVRPDEVDGYRPVEATYRVMLTMDDEVPELIHSSGGRGRIVTDDSTIGRRLVRYLRRTVRFDL